MKPIEQDYSIIVCKECGKTCKRLLAGLYPNGKDKKWVDESSREFVGRVCPTCHVDRVKSRKRRNKNSNDNI